ncbi:MAG: hypothetical protein AAB353_05325 [Candidatus Hydrogenedentota bacterium]
MRILIDRRAWSIAVAVMAAMAEYAGAQTAGRGAPTSPDAAAAAARRRFVTIESAKVERDGKALSVTYGNRLFVSTPDYARIATLKDGDVIEFAQSAAPKLKTAWDLKFGDLVIKTDNVAENYPGVYGLWIKKTGDGWRLVFNNKADLWGTMHDPTTDAGEAALEYAALSEPVQTDKIALDLIKDAKEKESERDKGRFKIALEENGADITMRITWGAHAWSAKFTAAP